MQLEGWMDTQCTIHPHILNLHCPVYPPLLCHHFGGYIGAQCAFGGMDTQCAFSWVCIWSDGYMV